MEERYFDLLVAGVGTAGALAAIAAARSGLRTASVEKACRPGGTAVNAGLTEMNAALFQGGPLYGGIEAEIFSRMEALGRGAFHAAVPMSSDPSVRVDRFRYDPEVLREILEEMLSSAGVTLFRNCIVTAAEEMEEECILQVRRRKAGDAARSRAVADDAAMEALTGPESAGTEFRLRSRLLIDATGNGTAVRLAGGEIRKTPETQRMIATLMFRLSGADTEALNKAVRSEGFRELVRGGRESGALPGGILGLTPVPGTRDISVNATGSCATRTIPAPSAGRRRRLGPRSRGSWSL